jgi:hypothetical protein
MTFTSTRFILLLGIPLAIYLLIFKPSLSFPSWAGSSLPDVDIIFSSYREDPSAVSNQINALRSGLKLQQLSSRVTLYVKDETLSANEIQMLPNRVGADVVRQLPNLGREGGTL